MIIKNIEEYLVMIDQPNRERCLELFWAYKDFFLVAPGSKVKHQAWEGGYIHHLEQVMALAEFKYQAYSKLKKLDFSLSDAILVVFLHDLEKPFKYVKGEVFENDNAKYDFILKQAFIFKIKLDEKHLNALKYIHGEGNDYDPHKNIQWPLAAFCHSCDNDSARIFFDFRHK